jgi:hypothetical protein
MAAFQRRKFDLVISDMARGDDMRAGYGLLKVLRTAVARCLSSSSRDRTRRSIGAKPLNAAPSCRRTTCSSWSTTS